MLLPNEMIKDYDRGMGDKLRQQYYGESGYYNYGYWESGIANQGEASDNLVRKLLEPISTKPGRILDVACGLGGSTRYLKNVYSAENVVAINISDFQIRHAHGVLPEVDVARMDAAHLAFADNSFDAIICVEAAFHFDSRDLFLREAFRILRPGGWLVFSDEINPKPFSWQERYGYLPKANHLVGPGDLRQRIERAGFQSVKVTDATDECWRPFRDNLRRFPRERREKGVISFLEYLRELSFVWGSSIALDLWVRRYLLCSAQRLAGDSHAQER